MNPIGKILGLNKGHYMTVEAISVYNLLIDLISFLFEVAILVMKMLDMGNISWWWVIAPPILIGVFNITVEEGVVRYSTREISDEESEE